MYVLMCFCIGVLLMPNKSENILKKETLEEESTIFSLKENYLLTRSENHIFYIY